MNKQNPFQLVDESNAHKKVWTVKEHESFWSIFLLSDSLMYLISNLFYL